MDTAPSAPERDSAAAAEASAPPVNRDERRALDILCLLALLLVIRVVLPLGIGLLLGTLTAFTLQPAYQSLCRRLGRPALAALLCTLAVLLGAGGSLAALAVLGVQHGLRMSRALVDALQPGGALRPLVDRFAAALHSVRVPPDDIIQRLRDAAVDLTTQIGGLAAMVASVTARGLLILFFLVLTTFYMLRQWGTLTRRLALLLPISPRHTAALLEELRRVGSSVLLGTLLTGIVQGALAGIGYACTGVPQPLFFGAITAVASLVPVVGTLLIWVPAGAWLLMTGHTALGVVELSYGALVVVGVSDYVIRPFLVGGHGEASTLLTFIALFGGIEAFGLIGLVLGPVIMSLTIALLRILEQERRRESAR